LPPKHPDGRPAEESYYEHNGRALAGEDVSFDLRIRRPFGDERLCRANLVRLPSDVRLLRASLVDITEQRAAEAYLAEVLSYTVIQQEAERRRIARELHDALGQYLAAMSMKLEICGRSAPDSSPLKAWLDELKSLTATVGDEVDRLAWELRPAVLDDIGLEPAIQRFVEEWARRSGLRFDLHLSLKRSRLPSDIETALYRVLQEGVTNIVKHAGATTVGVILKASADDAVMIIEDDGNGFELENLNRASSPRLGLLGMRERLAMVHGSLEIETRPGEGTTLIIRVALDGAPFGPAF
jgi:signal transduction histidine kinase